VVEVDERRVGEGDAEGARRLGRADGLGRVVRRVQDDVGAEPRERLAEAIEPRGADAATASTPRSPATARTV